MSMADRDSAAKRRRDRRLRMHWRHEQLTLQMALAAALHHSRDVGPVTNNALRSQRTVRAEEWGRELNYTATIRDPLSPSPASHTHTHTSRSSSALGARPDRLFGVRPQALVLRRTVQQIVDPVPSLPALDDPSPQMVEQLPDVLRFFRALSPDPEQVIEVPKILPEDVSLRTAVREPQLVEQLVEVPTIVSFSSLQRTVQQNVDIPTGGGLQGLHRGQGSTAFPEQTAESPDPGGSFQDFQPVQSSAASPSVSPGHAGQGVFRTFPQDKKSPEVAGQVDETMPRDVSSSTPAAYEVRHVVRDDLWEQIMTDDDPYFWHQQEQTAVWRMPPGTHPAWVRSRDGLFFHVESGQVLPSLSGSF